MEPLDAVNDSVEQRTQFWSQPPPYQAELDHEGSDVRTIRLIVSITLGLTAMVPSCFGPARARFNGTQPTMN